MLVCKKCKSTKLDGKWIPTHNMRKNITYILCPTCNGELKQISRGVVVIDGKFFQQNTKQSMQIINDEEQKAKSQNIYSRVILINRDRNPIIIKTTNPLLAIKIGKQFKRLFRGKLDIKEDQKNRVKVSWHLEHI